MSLESLLNTTVTLQRKSTSVDASLGAADSYTNVASNVAATIQPVSGKERWVLAQRGVYYTHKIYFAQDIGATPRDRILTSDGRTFIISKYFDQAGRGRVFMVEAIEQT